MHPHFLWHHTANLGMLARASGGDAARAGVLLEEGLAVTERLGMEPLRGQIIELRALHALKVGPVFPDGLTEREVEVLRQIAGGMTNREIAYPNFANLTEK